MNTALNKLYWHDGNLSRIAFDIDKRGKASLSISAAFYENEQAPSREIYEIVCEGVLGFTSTLDSAELKDNMGAGNIANGYLKGDTLWVYFSDGVLKVSARRFRLVTC